LHNGKNIEWGCRIGQPCGKPYFSVKYGICFAGYLTEYKKYDIMRISQGDAGDTVTARRLPRTASINYCRLAQHCHDILPSIANNNVVCNAAKSGCKAYGFAKAV